VKKKNGCTCPRLKDLGSGHGESTPKKKKKKIRKKKSGGKKRKKVGSEESLVKENPNGENHKEESGGEKARGNAGVGEKQSQSPRGYQIQSVKNGQNPKKKRAEPKKKNCLRHAHIRK